MECAIIMRRQWRLEGGVVSNMKQMIAGRGAAPSKQVSGNDNEIHSQQWRHHHNVANGVRRVDSHHCPTIDIELVMMRRREGSHELKSPTGRITRPKMGEQPPMTKSLDFDALLLSMNEPLAAAPCMLKPRRASERWRLKKAAPRGRPAGGRLRRARACRRAPPAPRLPRGSSWKLTSNSTMLRVCQSDYARSFSW